MKISIVAMVIAAFVWPMSYVRAEDEGEPKQRPVPRFISPAGKPYGGEPGEPFAKARWFAALDGDGNGEVTAADFALEAEQFFAELDTDADGRIALSEITHYEQVVAPEVQVGFRPAGVDGMGPPPNMPFPSGSGGGGPPGGGPPGGMGGGPPPGMGKMPSKEMMKRLANMPQGAARFAILGMPQPIMAADVNMNGSVTLEEMRGAAAQRFGWLDELGNNDGRLSWDELPQAPVEDMLKPSRRDKKKRDKKDEFEAAPGQRQPIP